jgi:peroxidase
LIISNANSHDVGSYQCQVGSLKSRSARVRFYRGRAKPTIIHSPASQTDVEKGQTIRLSCVAGGFPRPSFAWFKDGGRLSSAHSRYKIEDNGTLVITNAQLADSGHYRCSASNYLGRASSAAKVKVNLNIPSAAPVFTTFPRDADVRESSFVEFTCISAGQPYPVTSWWNNNRLVSSDGRISVSNGGQHLRIEDVKVYDSGAYVCRAENSLGLVEASAKLKVKSKPKPLELIVPPHDMTAPKGTTIQMPCKAQGFPEPSIKWLKDGHDMSSPRFDVRPDGSLIVHNVSEEDEGTYECIADNGIETKSAGARLAIRTTRDARPEPLIGTTGNGYSTGNVSKTKLRLQNT